MAGSDFLFEMSLGGVDGRRKLLRAWINLAIKDGNVEKAQMLYDKIVPMWKSKEDRDVIAFIITEIAHALGGD